MQNRKNIQTSATRLRIAVIGLLIVVVGAWFAGTIGVEFGRQVRVTTHYRDSAGIYAPMLSGAVVGLFAAALWRLAAMLKQVAAGDLFSSAVTRPFRDFALFMLLSSLAALLLPAAMMLLAPPPHVAGVREVAFRVELRGAIFVLASLVLFLVARLLEEAARIDAELDEIV